MASGISLERILADDLELGARLHHEGVTVLAQQKDLAVVGPRRRREAADVAREALTAVDLFAGLGVVTEQEAAVEQRVVVVAVDQRRGVVGAEHRLKPRDVLVAGFFGLERDVAGSAGTNGVDRPQRPAGIAGADIQQAILGKRRRNGQLRHRPDSSHSNLPSSDVGAHLARAGRDDLGALLVFPDDRRRPVARSRRASTRQTFFAGLGVERRQERFGRVVVDDVDAIFVEHGRAAGAQLDLGVEGAELFRPHGLAVQVQRVEHADAAEIHIDPVAVGDRRLRGVTVLHMPPHRRQGDVQLLLPTDLAGLESRRRRPPSAARRRPECDRARRRGPRPAASHCRS